VPIRDDSGDITVQTEGRLEILEDTSGEVEEL
jgi:hypothetical protein